MTSLRDALREACDIGDSLKALVDKYGPGRDQPPIIERRLADLRSLAAAPLTVLDALRDPSWRARASWVEIVKERWIFQYRYDVDGRGDPMASTRSRRHDGTWSEWRATTLFLADLDSPCRLVPAEGDRAKATPMRTAGPASR